MTDRPTPGDDDRPPTTGAFQDRGTSGTTAPDDHLLIPEVERSLVRAIPATGTGPSRSAVRRRPGVVIGSAVATAGVGAIVAAVVLAASPSGGPIDVLARAEAALAPRNELLHYVVRATPVRADGGLSPTALTGACAMTGDTEVWQVASPNRWRAILPAEPRGDRCGHLVDGRTNRRIRGRQVLSWDGNATARYVPANDTLDIIRGFPETSSAARVPIGDAQLGLGDGDPVAIIRGLMAHGRLRESGRTRLAGRDVVTLTGSRSVSGHGTTRTTEVLYAVDASTFEPVRAISTTRFRVGRRPDGRGLREVLRGPFSQQLDFSGFTRRPLDARGRSLLRIVPRRSTDVVDQTRKEFLRSSRARQRRQEREGRALARRVQRGDR